MIAPLADGARPLGGYQSEITVRFFGQFGFAAVRSIQAAIMQED